MQEDLASVRGVIDLSPQEALDEAQSFLTQQGYSVTHRTATTLSVERQTADEMSAPEGTLKLVVMAVPQPEGGVRLKVRGNDREGVRSRQAQWIEWSDRLPKKEPEESPPQPTQTTQENTTAAVGPQEVSTTLEGNIPQDRYCRNCGHELQLNDRFCPSCGRPVHETAHVPSPEADVVVPPPPQTDGTGAPSPPQQAGTQPQDQHRPVRRVLLGCLGVFVVVVLVASCLAALSGGGGGGGQDAANAPVENREREGNQGPQEAAPPPPPEPEPITLSGQGSQATDFFELQEGLSIFEMSYQGRANFVVTLLNEQGREVGYALGNEIGSGTVSNPLRIARAGRYVLDVDSDGPWQITVRQPRPADAPEITSFSGENNTATKLFSLSSGLKRVNATYDGGGNFVVTMLDSEGHETAYALVNEIGRGNYSTTVTVPRDGIYLFAVEADGPWTLQIE